MLNSGHNAAAQDRARYGKSVDHICRQQPQLRNHLVRCQIGSAQPARHRQRQEECCLHREPLSQLLMCHLPGFLSISGTHKAKQT